MGDERAVRRMVEAELQEGARIETVRKAPWADLYEVVLRGREGPLIYYVDSDARVIIAGSVIEAGTGRNLTEARQTELRRAEWDALPLHWAIPLVRGNGRRKIAVFSDPDCPQCARFHEELSRLDDVTIYVLPYAVLGAHSVRQAKAAWCSSDRAKAWTELILRRKDPQPPVECETPIERIIEFGRANGITTPPTWYLETGERLSGVMLFDEVQAMLDAVTIPAGR